MDTAQFGSHAEYVLELIGIVAFALSGAMLAIRKDFDVVGIVLLAEMAALGGGVVRDVLIGSVPPTAFRNLDYLLTRSRSGWSRRSPTRPSAGSTDRSCSSTPWGWRCSRSTGPCSPATPACRPCRPRCSAW